MGWKINQIPSLITVLLNYCSPSGAQGNNSLAGSAEERPLN